MPNKDWYWERFNVDVNQGELDLSDDQTHSLAVKDIEGRPDYTDTQRVNYETRFIDELYGTDERAWEREDGPRDDGTWRGRGEIGRMGSGTGRGADPTEHVTWGLDLVRDWTGKDNLTVGSQEHYEWQTRGTVDWAHYYDDNAYQKAFTEYRKENNIRSHSTLEGYLTADETGGRGSRAVGASSKVDFIEWANTEYESSESDYGDENLRDDWPNKYEDQFDPETAPDYVKTYLDVPDLWGEAEARSDWETPLTPITVVKPPSIPNLSDISRRQVEVPGNIQSWGGPRDAPSHTFTPGGVGATGGGSPPPPTTQGGNQND